MYLCLLRPAAPIPLLRKLAASKSAKTYVHGFTGLDPFDTYMAVASRKGSGGSRTEGSMNPSWYMDPWGKKPKCHTCPDLARSSTTGMLGVVREGPIGKTPVSGLGSFRFTVGFRRWKLRAGRCPGAKLLRKLAEQT